MAVIEQTISGKIKTFITQQQGSEQEDSDKAIQEFSDEMASIITEAILSMTITIQTGQIIVVGSATTQANPAPLVLQGKVNLK